MVGNRFNNLIKSAVGIAASPITCVHRSEVTGSCIGAGSARSVNALQPHREVTTLGCLSVRDVTFVITLFKRNSATFMLRLANSQRCIVSPQRLPPPSHRCYRFASSSSTSPWHCSGAHQHTRSCPRSSSRAAIRSGCSSIQARCLATLSSRAVALFCPSGPPGTGSPTCFAASGNADTAYRCRRRFPARRPDRCDAFQHPRQGHGRNLTRHQACHPRHAISPQSA